jgi:Sulfotransferase family
MIVPAVLTGDEGREAPAAPAPRRRADGPDFFCVGAQKGGTRWLYDQVQLHPDFWMPPVKELHYFDRNEPSDRSTELATRVTGNLRRLNRHRRKRHFRRLDQRDIDFLEAYAQLPWRKLDLEAYATLFAGKRRKISGDITPDYSVLGAEVIARVMTRFPEAKVIFMARDPVERVWSHLNMHMRLGDIDRSLTTAEVMRLVGQRFIARRTYQTEIVARWRQYVPEAQFGLFLFDDLLADPNALRARILSFLGADPGRASGKVPADYNRKSDPEKVPLSAELRDRLSRYLAAELTASARDFGGAAVGWPAKYGL